MRARRLVRPLLVGAVSVAVVAAGAAGTTPASAATGDISEFAFADAAALPQAIAADADGTLWITLRGSGLLAKSTLSGTITMVLTGGTTPNTGPDGIALGPDQRMWLAEETANRISAVTTATGAVQSFDLLARAPSPARSRQAPMEHSGSQSPPGTASGESLRPVRSPSSTCRPARVRPRSSPDRTAPSGTPRAPETRSVGSPQPARSRPIRCPPPDPNPWASPQARTAICGSQNP